MSEGFGNLSHFVNALEALRSNADDEEGIAELGAKLAGLDDAIAQNDYRAANIRAGYVYVISNRGAFGKAVVLEFTDDPESTQYLQSRGYWPEVAEVSGPEGARS